MDHDVRRDRANRLALASIADTIGIDGHATGAGMRRSRPDSAVPARGPPNRSDALCRSDIAHSL